MKNFNPIIKQSVLRKSALRESTLRMAAVVALAIAAVPACKNPIENISVAVTTESLSQSPTLVKFVKANPEGPELPSSINVTISGPGKEFVQSDDGGKTFTAVEGRLPITLNRFAKPTPDNPVVFSISANVEGYVPVSKMISISSPEMALQLELELMSYAAPVKGTAVVQTEKQLTAGVVGTEIQIATTASANTPQTATLTLPAGTQVLDANKQPINAGDLKASIVFYGTMQKESMDAAMKNMLVVNPIVNGEVSKGQAQFINTGNLSIQMTAGNTPVKYFSQPITAKVELNPDMLHPVTGLPLKAGDQLHVWSMNEETGQWSFENLSSVVSEGGKLKAVMSINHLSVWAPITELRWLRFIEAQKFFFNSECITKIKLKLGADISEYEGYQVARFPEHPIIIIGPYNYSYFMTEVYNLATLAAEGLEVTNFTGFFNIAPTERLAVFSRPADLNAIVAEIPLSGCGEKVLEIPAPPPTNRIKTEISIKGICTNKKLVIYPDDTWVEIKDVTDNVTTNQVIRKGKLDLKLKAGHEYSVTAIYDGKTYTSRNMMIEEFMDVDMTSGSGLKITGAYDQGAKKLVLNAEFPLSNCK